MKAIRLGVFVAVLLGWVVHSRAQTELPAAAREVLKQFEEEAAEIERKSELELNKCREKLTGELKKVQDDLCKEAKLDEAVAVRDLIRSIKAGQNGPFSADLPAAAREVLKQQEADLTAIQKKAEAEVEKRREKILVELKKMQDAFCKEAKLDEAVAIRDLIRNGVGPRVNALPDPGYVNNQQTDIGKVFYYAITGAGNGSGQSIYGTDVYTTGSHLGMVAVHCGLLQEGQKGVVKVTILPGQANYAATTRNGVTSLGYGTWNVSFKAERVYGFIGKVEENLPPPDKGTKDK
jgi:hypothetical protein